MNTLVTLARRRHNLLRVGQSVRHRLLAQDVLARRDGRQRHLGVQRVGGADADGVHLVQREHLGVVREDVLRPELIRRRLRPRLVQIADAEDLHAVPQLPVALQMHSPDADAHHADPYLFVRQYCRPPLLFCALF